MKQLFLLFLFVLSACKEAPKDAPLSENTSTKLEQNDDIGLEIYDYDGLKPLINVDDNTIHVVNFWATWCAPCIKELPYFEKLNADYKEKNVEVLLVSLDFPRKYETHLIPFLKKNSIQSKVVCLDDVDQNRWVPAINETWSGALPATIIYKGDKRKFFEKSFTYEELQNEVQQFLNP
ncbi:MAG: TlpA family protein disulfide reductase [Winogradskyella sp.]|uniref:TlpA disulfide reductase family protein n=1 Tax=Winogradskyella sp. TaxID=1883156 RepID=UPI000F3F16F4|nr:TlpA disulfide reductase family protein [Winogradskyella sp.]RNC85022.1 MAG: TlpA family protein disulfide reductase [Winogradskyella sp.]